MRLLWSGLIAVMLAAPAGASVTLYDWTGVVTYGTTARSGHTITGTLGIPDAPELAHSFDYGNVYYGIRISAQLDGIDYSQAGSWYWTVANGRDSESFQDAIVNPPDSEASLSMAFGNDDTKTWGMEIRQRIGEGLYAASEEFGGIINTIAKRPPPNSQQTSSQIEDNDLHT